MEKNKPFIVLQTKVEDGVIYVYGFLDEGCNELHKHFNWYRLTLKGEKEI
jgi:hypothetical protein